MRVKSVTPSTKTIPYERYTGLSIHPEIDEVLDETYGILVFQESLMELYAKATGNTFAQSDSARRAITKYKPGKKSTEEAFEKAKQEIINGLTSNYNMEYKDAEHVVGTLLKQAGYGFNKSHAIAYSYITMYTLYYKHYYPTYFYAALLNNTSDPNKKQSIIYEIIGRDFDIKPPNVNKSDPIKYIADDNSIFMPLTALSGFSDLTALEVTAHRPYRSPKDFMSRVSSSAVNSSNRAKMLISGSFDDIGGDYSEYQIDPKSLLFSEMSIGDLTKELKTFTYPARKKGKTIDYILAIISDMPVEDDKEFYEWINNLGQKEFAELTKLLSEFAFGEQVPNHIARTRLSDDRTGFFKAIKGEGSGFTDKSVRDRFCYNVVFPTSDMLKEIDDYNKREGYVAGQVQKIFVDEYNGKKTRKFYLHNNYRVFVPDWKTDLFERSKTAKEGDWVMAQLWQREDGSVSNYAETFRVVI